MPNGGDDMAKVNQRLWRVPGLRTKRKAWGFTAQVDGKQKRVYKAEWATLSSVPRIRLEKEPQGRLRWLTPEEATSLFEACSESRNADLPDLVEFVLFTGLRRGEALGLTWERVDRARGVVLLNVTKN